MIAVVNHVGELVESCAIRVREFGAARRELSLPEKNVSVCSCKSNADAISAAVLISPVQIYSTY